MGIEVSPFNVLFFKNFYFLETIVVRDRRTCSFWINKFSGSTSSRDRLSSSPHLNQSPPLTDERSKLSIVHHSFRIYTVLLFPNKVRPNISANSTHFGNIVIGIQQLTTFGTLIARVAIPPRIIHN